MPTMTNVAIIGGGLAGLQAARALSRAGIDCRLIEARPRLGGRILTVDATGMPAEDGFDLGPSWFWPAMQPALAALVSELDLPAFPQNSDGDVIFHRMSRETPQRYRGLRQDPQSWRFVGGTAALIRALARDIDPKRVRLGARVTAIALDAEGVTITLAEAGEAVTTLRAEHVIAALPPRLLATTIAWSPSHAPATAHHWHETPTWMAPHAKFFAVYDRAFWRDAGLSGTAQSMVGPLVEIHDATTAAGVPALFGFLGVSADQRARLGDAALSRACIEQLAQLFGPLASQPEATLLKDWAADSLTATDDDRVAGGHPVPDGTPWVTGPWAHRLSLAGSETSRTEPGYLAGAIEAADRAVNQTLARLGIPVRG